MLRSLLIYLSKASWAQRLVMGWGFAWPAASRSVAGTRIEDALRVIRDLNARGINVTLDHLGEHTSTAAEAGDATAAILDTLRHPEIGTLRQCVNQADADWPGAG